MTVFHPCFHCHRKAECPIKAQAAKALRGFNITKANIRCGIPKQDFPPGTTVEVRTFVLADIGDFEPTYKKEPAWRRGVIARWKGSKATVALNKDQEIEQPSDSAIGYLSVTPDRLGRVDVPLVELCHCGLTQERCQDGDYPSVRNGEFQCWDAETVRHYD